LHRFCLIHPCDGQTDRRTDRRTELRWLRRAIAVPAVARKNWLTGRLCNRRLLFNRNNMER